jgi:hypothetical protein
MKTPRELLLSRHESAQPRLDALCRAILAEHVGPASEPVVRGAGRIVSLRRVLTGFFWMDRWAWLGLGAAWVVILGLAVATPGSSQPRSERRDAGWRPSVMPGVLGEQARLRQELLGGESGAPVVPPGDGPTGPRSESRGPAPGAAGAMAPTWGSDSMPGLSTSVWKERV